MVFIYVILVIVLFFLMLIPTLIVSLISRILSFFGLGKRKSSTWSSYSHSGSYNSERTSRKSEKKNDGRKRLFDKDEGEYVDFEEIK